MTNRFKIALAAASVLAIASMATPASAVAIISSCSVVGLDDIVPNAQACAGYYDKNVLKTDAGDLAKADEVAALNLLGLTGTIAALEKINNSGDFDTLLNGLTWIGVHYGRGNGPVNTPGGVTAFYRFDAGTNLDKLQLHQRLGLGRCPLLAKRDPRARHLGPDDPRHRRHRRGDAASPKDHGPLRALGAPLNKPPVARRRGGWSFWALRGHRQGGPERRTYA